MCTTVGMFISWEYTCSLLYVDCNCRHDQMRRETVSQRLAALRSWFFVAFTSEVSLVYVVRPQLDSQSTACDFRKLPHVDPEAVPPTWPRLDAHAPEKPCIMCITGRWIQAEPWVVETMKLMLAYGKSRWWSRAVSPTQNSTATGS